MREQAAFDDSVHQHPARRRLAAARGDLRPRARGRPRPRGPLRGRVRGRVRAHPAAPASRRRLRGGGHPARCRRPGAAAAVSDIVDSLRSMPRRPDRITLEFGVKVTAEAGVVVARSTAEAHFTVGVEWETAPDSGTTVSGTTATGTPASAAPASGATASGAPDAGTPDAG
ncbi:CU044_2847 family protein [Streptomyces sp. UP1A-1]|nr:CU044_2847 family protein [Streptomyces sp. UP1A-1]